MRIDKYLWAVRIFKTRSLATEACKKGKITINEFPVKPSREVKAGEKIQVKKNPVNYLYQVIEPLEKRVSAKLVENYIKDITPADELLKLEMANMAYVKRDRGAGRPTKKERRILDNLFE